MKGAFLRRSLLPLMLLAFLLVRLNALFAPDSSGWAVVDDELPTGNIAVDLDQGLVLPVPAYQFKPFAAGTVIEGALSYPFRRLVGPSLLALKLAALTIQMLALVCWYLALWRLAGSVAALVFAFLSVLPPPAWLHLSHTAWGNHAEQALFVGFLLLLLSRFRASRTGGGFAFFAGLLAGFGVTFSYSGIPGAVWLLLMLVLLGGPAGRRNLPFALGGLAAGLAPLTWSASFYGWAALGRIDTYTGYADGELVTAGRLFLERDWSVVPAKLAKLALVDLPAASLYPSAEVRYFFFAVIVLSLTVWAVIGRRRWRDKPAERPATIALFGIPLYGLIYLLILACSGFRVATPPLPEPRNYPDYRYLAPLFPVALALIAVGFQFGWRTAKSHFKFQVIFVLSMTLLLAAFTVPYYHRYAHGPFSLQVLQTRGDSYSHVVERLAMTVSRHEWSPAERLAALDRLPKKFHRIFYEMIGMTGERGVAAGLAMTDRTDGSYRADIRRGYGMYRGALLAGRPPATWPASVLEDLRKVNLGQGSGEEAAEFLKGIGAGLSRQSRIDPPAILAAFSAWQSLRPDDFAKMAQGVGRFAGATLSYNLARLQGLPSDFWVGLGGQIARNVDNMLLCPAPVTDVLFDEDPAIRAALLRGFIEELDSLGYWQ